MEKIITVDGKQVRMVANALIPRMYRNIYGSDIMLDMQELTNAYVDSAKNDKPLPPKVLTIFENVAWCFLKQGGEDVGANADEWLAQLDGVFSVYEALPQILELWQLNLKTTAKPSRKG